MYFLCIGDSDRCIVFTAYWTEQHTGFVGLTLPAINLYIGLEHQWVSETICQLTDSVSWPGSESHHAYRNEG